MLVMAVDPPHNVASELNEQCPGYELPLAEVLRGMVRPKAANTTEVCRKLHNLTFIIGTLRRI